MNKKHYIIATAIFVLITGLAYASNTIQWNETPLEQSIMSLPLVVGFLLEMPYFFIMSLYFENAPESTYIAQYDFSFTIAPFVTGLFYTALYCLIILGYKRWSKMS